MITTITTTQRITITTPTPPKKWEDLGKWEQLEFDFSEGGDN